MRRAILSILIGLAAYGAGSGSWAGETACWFDHGAIVVPAAFGDIAGDFLLDPATPKSQLNATNAQMFGILTPVARADLRVAGERLRGFELTATDLGARERPFAAGLVGVIGGDALSGFVTEIQTEPCRVKLARRAGRRWPIRLPLKTIGGMMAVPAAVSDGATSRAGWFAVATAQPGVTVADAKLTRAPAKDADPDWPPARLRALSLGGLLFEQIPANVTEPPAPGLSGALGEDVWWTFRLRLDPARGRLELAPARPGP
ncbi:MAG TPA: hypothetical protein VGF42_10025 [Caulobacteraceae bacterium]|jgi:hypothetical protein